MSAEIAYRMSVALDRAINLIEAMIEARSADSLTCVSVVAAAKEALADYERNEKNWREWQDKLDALTRLAGPPSP